MPKPIGIVTKRKNNDNKHYRDNEEWQKGKKLGRPKQQWVWDDTYQVTGHWEKQ